MLQLMFGFPFWQCPVPSTVSFTDVNAAPLTCVAAGELTAFVAFFAVPVGESEQAAANAPAVTIAATAYHFFINRFPPYSGWPPAPLGETRRYCSLRRPSCLRHRRPVALRT